MSASEKRTLALLCDTLIPPLAGNRPIGGLAFGAATSGTADELARYVLEYAPPSRRRNFARLLRLAEHAWFNGLTGGIWKALSRMTRQERTALLVGWRDSRWSIVRRAFQVLKHPTLFLFYSRGAVHDGAGPKAAADGANGSARGSPFPAARSSGMGAEELVWNPTGYRPPAAWRAQAEWGAAQEANGRLRPLAIGRETELGAEVLVIGSGAGGGVVAGELAAAGHDVLVLEKGGYFADTDFRASERFGVSRLYDGGGWLASEDLGVGILAGSTVGGGTTVNWMTCLEPPVYVLEEWQRDYGFDAAAGPDLRASLRAVSERLGVTTDESVTNRHNAILEAGCRALGYRVAAAPRNTSGCRTCGFCSWGCALGRKQDIRKTYLADACEHGARLLARAEVRRVRHAAGRVTGADVVVTGDDGARRELRVRAKAVVVAAGAVQTPALLLRSGLANKNIGAGLRLHPTAPVFGRYREPVYSWRGPLQTRYSEEFADLDGCGYGVRLEVCPAHPGLWALALPWASGRAHKRLMRCVHQMANIIVLTRDRYGGRVTIDDSGRPVVRYRLHGYDRRHLMRGIVEAIRVHAAAGADTLLSPHATPMVCRRSREGHSANGCRGAFGRPEAGDGQARSWPAGGSYNGDFEGYVEAVRRRGAPRNGIGLASAHQLASCRIAADRRRGAVDPEGQAYEVQNLFVADGSLMPTACGVNPMITIMGLAHYVAQHIKTKLGAAWRGSAEGPAPRERGRVSLRRRQPRATDSTSAARRRRRARR